LIGRFFRNYGEKEEKGVRGRGIGMMMMRRRRRRFFSY